MRTAGAECPRLDVLQPATGFAKKLSCEPSGIHLTLEKFASWPSRSRAASSVAHNITTTYCALDHDEYLVINDHGC